MLIPALGVCSVEAYSSLVTIKYSLHYYQCPAENSIKCNGVQFLHIGLVPAQNSVIVQCNM